MRIKLVLVTIFSLIVLAGCGGPFSTWGGPQSGGPNPNPAGLHYGGSGLDWSVGTGRPASG